ncbi:fimbria/pilus periplasmic chaperone [Vibrio parahaemolyticus]|nr:fimbria/pilus periplasmic chaperone [Vibrio parahaemolyticus]
MKKYLLLCLVPLYSFSSESIVLERNRIIHTSNISSIKIQNKKKHPVIIRVEVLNEKKERSKSFLSTPPIFKMEENSTNIIRIISRDGSLPNDREELFWFCVESISPDETASAVERKEGHKEKLLVNIKGCIKLLNRPSSLGEQNINETMESLKWTDEGEYVSIFNPTPYYVNFGLFELDNNNSIGGLYINPKDSIKINKSKSKWITWNIIDDFGATTKDTVYGNK